MNLYEFIEVYIYPHFFDVDRLENIQIPFKEHTMQADEILCFLFALVTFVVGVFITIYIPYRFIRFLARGGRK